jgi:hypothetical protein
MRRARARVNSQSKLIGGGAAEHPPGYNPAGHERV